MTPKDVLTNPYFCPMPWTGIMYNFDGTVKNCIRSAGTIGNIKESSIENIILGEQNIENQHNIIKHIPVTSCHTCYDLEHGKKGLDIISDRIFYIRELKKIPTHTYNINNFDLQTIDVRWSNLCNFSCVYCGPEFSSKWANELKIYPQEPDHHAIDNFKNYIYDNAGKLKHVYLAGGEPLLMKENLELLEQLSPDVNLRVNTNLSMTGTKVFETICKFKNVHWTVSVETTGNEYEFIRYGGIWEDFLRNLQKIKTLNHKITFNMLWFLLNYKSIFKTIDYFKELGFHNNSFVIGALLNPQYLNIRHLPKNVLNYLEDELTHRINQQPKYLLEDSYKNMLHYIQQPMEKDLNNSFKKLKEIDNRRGLDSSKIFTDLYKLKEEI